MIDETLRDRIILTCNTIAGDYNVTSICLYGSRACGYAREDSDYDILLILDEYSDGVRYHYKTIRRVPLAVLAVNQKALESDVNTGALGDFVSGRLLSPYVPLLNQQYTKGMEIAAKRRFAREDIDDLIIEYGDLARGLIIKPEYLALSRMEKRSRAYPPLRYSYVNMLRKDLKDKNMEVILNGYYRALEDLALSRIIKYDGENVTIRNSYVDSVLSSRVLNKVANLMTLSRRAFSSYLVHSKAGKVSLEVVAKELSSKLKRELQIAFNKREIEDSRNYLFLKTEKGLISLNKEDTLIQTLRKTLGRDKVVLKSLGGALNEVYLISVDEEKLVVKKFTDWYNFKWFILNIAAYGTKLFTLSGRTRLSNEYVTNRLLAENNIAVPDIVSISLEDRLLVERYIEGQSVLDIIIDVGVSDLLKEEHKTSAIEVGKLLSKIHALKITVGDCKPENFIVETGGRVYVLDLEQGTRYGDKAWDLAEFLYFSGRFASALTGGFLEFVRAFIEGYSADGERKVLKAAAGLNYSRVFLAWAPLPIIQGISKILKNA